MLFPFSSVGKASNTICLPGIHEKMSVERYAFERNHSAGNISLIPDDVNNDE
jgi:hypothetical protein